MAGPLVTIAMPVYNGERYFAEALASVRAQTYRNLEIIICDNASTDGTPDICTRAAREDARIRYVRREQAITVSENFNYGRGIKRGELFMWAADDDVRESEYVEAAVEAFERDSNAVLVHTHSLMIDAHGAPLSEIAGYDERISFGDLCERLRAFSVHPYRLAAYGLISARHLDAVPLMSNKADPDGELLLRLLLRGPFVIIPRMLFRYRLHRDLAAHHAQMFQSRGGDLVLGRLSMYRRIIRRERLNRAMRRKAVAAVTEEMQPELEARYTWLVGELLRTYERRIDALRCLSTWGRQYPEMLRTRFTFGAAARILFGLRGSEPR